MNSQNPYQHVRTLRTQRSGTHRIQVVVYCTVVLTVIFLLSTPLEQYLSGPQGPQRLEQMLFRVAALLVSLTTLQTYGDVVRHPERSIFAIHPVRSTLFMKHVGQMRLESSVLWLVMAIGIWKDVSADWWPWITFYLVSAWLGGIGAGYGIHLGSVWAARAPSIAGVLDSIRGQNPREQAAFIYAPGVVLGVVGLALIVGAGATKLVIEGQIQWVWWLTMPLLLGLVGWIAALRLAPSQLIRGGMLLTDIDAHWGMVDGEENPREVYLEWTSQDDPNRLRLLRQAWRMHRWITFVSWSMGGLLSIALWVGDEWSVRVGLGLTSTLGLGIPLVLQKHEPRWLQRSLGIADTIQIKALTEVSILLMMGTWLPVSVGLLLSENTSIVIDLSIRILAGMGLLYWMSTQVVQKSWQSAFVVVLSLLLWGTVLV